MSQILQKPSRYIHGCTLLSRYLSEGLQNIFKSTIYLLLFVLVFTTELLAENYPAFLRESFRIILVAPKDGHAVCQLKEGDYFKKGQVVFKVNQPGIKLRLEKAELTLRQAEANFAKIKKQKEIESKEVYLKRRKQEFLHRAGGLSDDAWKIAKVELEVKTKVRDEDIVLAQIAVDQAKNEKATVLQKVQASYVRCPADCAVSRKLIQNNEWVKANQRLGEIIGIDPLIIYLNVPFQKIKRFKKLNQVKARVIKGRKSFDILGTVRSVAKEIDAIHQTIQVQLQVANPRHDFLPGMKVNVLVP